MARVKGLTLNLRAESDQLRGDLQRGARHWRRYGQDVEESNNRLVASVRRATRAIGPALAGAVSVGAVASFARTINRSAVELGRLSRQANTSVRDIQLLERTFRVAGLTSGQARDSIAEFNERLGEAQATGAGALYETFERLGVSIEDVNGNLRSQVDLLTEVDRVTARLSSGERSFAFQELLAGEGRQVAGIDISRELGAAAGRGGFLTEGLSRSAERLDLAWDRLVDQSLVLGESLTGLNNLLAGILEGGLEADRDISRVGAGFRAAQETADRLAVALAGGPLQVLLGQLLRQIGLETASSRREREAAAVVAAEALARSLSREVDSIGTSVVALTPGIVAEAVRVIDEARGRRDVQEDRFRIRDLRAAESDRIEGILQGARIEAAAAAELAAEEERRLTEAREAAAAADERARRAVEDRVRALRLSAQFESEGVGDPGGPVGVNLRAFAEAVYEGGLRANRELLDRRRDEVTNPLRAIQDLEQRIRETSVLSDVRRLGDGPIPREDFTRILIDFANRGIANARALGDQPADVRELVNRILSERIDAMAASGADPGDIEALREQHELLRQLAEAYHLLPVQQVIEGERRLAAARRETIIGYGQAIDQGLRSAILSSLSDGDFRSVGEVFRTKLQEGLTDALLDSIGLTGLFEYLFTKLATDALSGSAGTSVLGSLFGFQGGGRPPVGRASIVGEAGPELFIPDSAGTILPNHRLGGGGPVTVVYNISRLDAPAARQAVLDTIPLTEAHLRRGLNRDFRRPSDIRTSVRS